MFKNTSNAFSYNNWRKLKYLNYDVPYENRLEYINDREVFYVIIRILKSGYIRFHNFKDLL